MTCNGGCGDQWSSVIQPHDEKGLADMIVCAPVTKEGMIDPRWGRADWVAVADVVDGEIVSWQEVEVSWSRLHDEGAPGSHHARVVTFLREHHVEAVVANHIGDGMVRMLDTMGLPVHLGAAGDARAAVASRKRGFGRNPLEPGLRLRAGSAAWLVRSTARTSSR